jgi:Pyruvate/2-oxoacid:ferredoxin oxidoreductase delta subunit
MNLCEEVCPEWAVLACPMSAHEMMSQEVKGTDWCAPVPKTYAIMMRVAALIYSQLYVPLETCRHAKSLSAF